MSSWLRARLKELSLPEILLIGIAFFLPFERIGSFDAFGVTIRISHLLLLALLAYFFLDWLRRKEKFHSNVLIWALFLFLVSGLVSLKNAVNPERGIQVIFFTAFIFCLPMLMMVYIKTTPQLQKIIRAIFLGAAVVTLFGLYQFFGDLAGLPTWLTGLRPQYVKAILGFPRVQSTSLEPLYFANYLLIPLSFVISLLVSKSRTPKQRLFFGALLGLISINILLTSSRGGIIAAAFSLLILLILFKAELKNSSLKKILLGSIIFILLFLSVKTFFPAYFSHLITLNDGAAVADRLNTFQPAWQIWREHIGFGIGPGNFGPAQAPDPLVMPSSGWKIVNNEYLELLAENGLMGFLIFAVFHLLLLIQCFKTFKKIAPELKPYLAAALAAWIGIWIQYQTFSVLYITHVWFVAGLLMAFIKIETSDLDPNATQC